MDERSVRLLDKCEAMSLLCSKATSYWSLLKFIFQLPLIFTSAIMCVLNAMENETKNTMKLPNIVVNGVSVMVLSISNQLKVPEKVELFKNLSNQFLLLAHSIEALEPENITREIINTTTEKYDILLQQCLFEDIPKRYKMEVIKAFEGRAVPLQLNGASGLVRPSHVSSQIV